jgi:hypothetical protein
MYLNGFLVTYRAIAANVAMLVIAADCPNVKHMLQDPFRSAGGTLASCVRSCSCLRRAANVRLGVQNLDIKHQQVISLCTRVVPRLLQPEIRTRDADGSYWSP